MPHPAGQLSCAVNPSPSSLSLSAVTARTRDATRRARSAALVASVVFSTFWITGCATVANPDPLEPMNRKLFNFNEGVDRVVMQPTAKAYKAVVPEPARTGVSNFFSNLADPWSGVNLMLQGRFRDGFSDLGRFGANTTVGLLGTMDVASNWGMLRHGESFANTLGAWGVAPGAYLVVPLLGPSDARGLAALTVNSAGNLQSQVSNVAVSNSLLALNMVNKRADFLESGKLIDEAALDKYTFVRDAYIQRRKGPRVDSTAPTQDD